MITKKSLFIEPYIYTAFFLGLIFSHPSVGYSTPLPQLPANECDLTNTAIATKPCQTQPGVGANGAVGNQSLDPGGSNFVGARSIALNNADTAIHAWGYCFYVNNASAETIFVPFNSSREVAAFLNDLPPAITVPDCSVPGQVMVPPNFPGVPQANQCANNPPSLPVNVPKYAPYASAVTATATYTGSPATPFSCVSSDGTSFTETATATFSQVDSGNPVFQVGWTTSTVVYTYDGICGSANGVATTAAPSNDLCHVGVAPNAPVQDASGNWTWTCFGGNGPGSHDASCSAGGQVNGQCNVAITSVPSSTAPTGQLCTGGTASGVSGGTQQPGTQSYTPWTWTCTGSNGGSTATCTEPYANTPTDGQCDPATNGVATPTAPAGNLCSAGTPSSVGGGVTVGNVTSPWTWTCAGINGGKTVNCSAPDSAPAPVDGVCNAATESTATNTTPTGTLCDAGTPTALAGGSGSNWTWSCDGSGGGTNASCSAPWAGASCNFTVGSTTKVYPDGAKWTKTTHTGHAGDCKGGGGTTDTTDNYVCNNGVVDLVSQTRVHHPCTDSCFPPDTPVLTADRGWQPISQIKRGDMVVTFDTKGNKSTAMVMNLKITPDNDLRIVNGIRMSHLQEVQLATGEYREVKNLKLGDALVDTDGNPQPIVSLTEEPERITVYNLIMADHSIPFFAAGIRVKDWKETDPALRK